MEIEKKCAHCGKVFMVHKVTTRYCCNACRKAESRVRERESKKKALVLDEKEPISNVKTVEVKPLLSPMELAAILGVSRASVYRYFAAGTIKAVKFRNRTLIRWSDVERVFEEAKEYKKRVYRRKADKEYYTMREIMEKYHIGKKAVWSRCDRYGIAKIYEGRNTFFSKQAVDTCFAELLDEIDLDNYYTVQEVMEKYNMSKSNVLSFVYRNKIPRINRGKDAYYSKVHIDSYKRKGDDLDPDWYTYEEIKSKYPFSKDQISYMLRNFDIKTEKRGKFTMIFRTDFDKLAHKRLADAIKIESPEGKKVVMQPKPKDTTPPPTPEGYYSAIEVAEKYNLSVKHIWKVAKEHQLPKIVLKHFNFYEIEAVEELFSRYKRYSDITDWITPEEMEKQYNMTPDARRSFAYRHKIPTKIEHGETFYSKGHIDKVKNADFDGRKEYYSVQEAMKKFKLTKDVVFYYVKQYKIPKIKVGQYAYIHKVEFNQIMAQKRAREKESLLILT